MSILFSELQSRICECITIFYSQDSYLVTNNANERSMTFRLGMYLQRLFPLWDVDCEYNREMGNIKCLPGKTSVFPDVIIHKRGTASNLLVIEVKTAKRVKQNPEKANADIDKLQEYLLHPDLRYQFGLFVEIKKDVETTWENLKWCVAENGNVQWFDQKENKITKPLYSRS